MAVLMTMTEDTDVELDTTTVTQTAVAVYANATQEDLNYARTGIAVTSSTNSRVRSRKVLTPVTEFWFHGVAYASNLAGSGTIAWCAKSRANSDIDQFRLVYTGTASTVQFQRNNAGSFVSLGASFSFSTGTPHTLDIHCKIDGAAGILALYLDGSLVASFSGAALATQHNVVDSFGLSSFANGASTSWSECVVADESTIGWRVKTIAPNAAGNQNDFSNSYTAVDEVAIDLADFAASNTTGHISLYAQSNLNAGDYSRQIKAVVVTTTVLKSSDSTPTDAQVAIRSGGTNAFSSNLSLAVGRNDVQTIYATNPVTTAAWTAAEIDAVEIGIKAV